MNEQQAAAISRGQRARIARLAPQPRPVLVSDPSEMATCVDPGCDWVAEGESWDVRSSSRAHVRATDHEVLLTRHTMVRMSLRRTARALG